MDASYSNQLVFWLNGVRVEISNPDPGIKLTDYLRQVGLTGTKVSCGQGGCGACTVMLSQKRPDGTTLHRPINACLRLLCTVDGMLVTTTEGIGSVHHGLDPTQVCLAKYNGSQCGFCTPGFVMNTHAFLQQNPAPQSSTSRTFMGVIFVAVPAIGLFSRVCVPSPVIMTQPLISPKNA